MGGEVLLGFPCSLLRSWLWVGKLGKLGKL